MERLTKEELQQLDPEAYQTWVSDSLDDDRPDDYGGAVDGKMAWDNTSIWQTTSGAIIIEPSIDIDDDCYVWDPFQKFWINI